MTDAQVTAPLSDKELYAAASENIRMLRNGETTPAVSNAVVNNIAVMLRIAKMQLDYARLTGRTPEIPLLITGNTNEKTCFRRSSGGRTASE